MVGKTLDAVVAAFHCWRTGTTCEAFPGDLIKRGLTGTGLELIWSRWRRRSAGGLPTPFPAYPGSAPRFVEVRRRTKPMGVVFSDRTGPERILFAVFITPALAPSYSYSPTLCSCGVLWNRKSPRKSAGSVREL